MESEGIEQEAVDTVKKNMYVDDLMKSSGTVEKAIRLVEQLRELLSRGGFRLTKWCSNKREVLSAIPLKERAKSVANLEIEKLPTESTLGLKWNAEQDQFVWEISEEKMNAINNKAITRRCVLSVIYSVFDPLGFIAPFTMKAKLLLQTLCRKKVTWDADIEDPDRAQWERWISDLPKLKNVNVSRCFKPEEFGEVETVELHVFSDASRVGYAAVAYLRFVNTEGKIWCAFVIGKTRLAPIREISIPRLELSAAVVSVKLRVLVQRELDMVFNQVYHWTDSTSVLKCIHNESKRFHTYESNRLTVILNESSRSEWRYVNTDANSADDGSKGMKLEEFLKNNRWITGPPFLWKEKRHWPKMIEVPEMKDDDPELRKEVQVYVTTNDQHPVDKLIEYHSSWWKLKKSVAWLLKYKGWLLKRPDQSSKHLTVRELQYAEREILRYVQMSSFPGALKILTDKSPVDSKAKKKALQKEAHSIYRLNPQVKDELLIAGGRLDNAPIDENTKHPIILPYKNHVTDLIVQDCHENIGHMGQETVLTSLRSKFWIVKGRSAVRRNLRQCQSCKRRKARPGEQFMGNLPSDRLTPDKPPFTYVGIDFFGPFEVKQGRSVVKRYGCIFTCLAIRAIHVEIAHSLDVDSMINALRRFIAIRGCPERIRSDRGTNFTAANNELEENLKSLDNHKIRDFCLKKEIDWVFNPPASSHKGGVWERMIRTVRQVLRTTLKQQLVSDEVLSTFMAEAVYIINSRPLTRNSDDHGDENPITPNHLLHLRPCPPSLPPGTFEKSDLYVKRAWSQAQYLAQVFWRRWTSEYLPTLLERQKWNVRRRNIRVGDVVLVADDNYPRGNWPLARVVEAYTVPTDWFVSRKSIPRQQ